MRIQLACLDMAGTTITDDGVVEEAARVALEKTQVDLETGLEFVRATMGQSKIAVFGRLLGPDLAASANEAFERAYASFVAGGAVAPLPGAVEAIVKLHEKGIKVALTTGFSAATQASILDALGWHDLVDFALTPGSGLRGRPAPDLVLRAALLAGVDAVDRIAVAGDSVSDMRCGMAAGAGVVAGILGGAHDAEALRAAGATHLLPSVAALCSVAQ